MHNIVGTLLDINIINSYIASVREYLIKVFKDSVCVSVCARACGV
jgi:hypothetical protein